MSRRIGSTRRTRPVAADHERQLALLERDRRARDRRVEHPRAERLDVGGKRALFDGDAVDVSTQTFPGPRPARIPSGPPVIASSAFVLVTIEKTTSTLGRLAGVPTDEPALDEPCAFSRVRL